MKGHSPLRHFLFTSCDHCWGQGKGSVRFQNNDNLNLGLTRRDTVSAIV